VQGNHRLTVGPTATCFSFGPTVVYLPRCLPRRAGEMVFCCVLSFVAEQFIFKDGGFEFECPLFIDAFASAEQTLVPLQAS